MLRAYTEIGPAPEPARALERVAGRLSSELQRGDGRCYVRSHARSHWRERGMPGRRFLCTRSMSWPGIPLSRCRRESIRHEPWRFVEAAARRVKDSGFAPSRAQGPGLMLRAYTEIGPAPEPARALERVVGRLSSELRCGHVRSHARSHVRERGIPGRRFLCTRSMSRQGMLRSRRRRNSKRHEPWRSV